MTDELVDLLAHASSDAVVRIEVWPNGIGNEPPPREFNRPARTVHVDPIDTAPPSRPTKILYVPAGTGKNIRTSPGIKADNVRILAPAGTAITVYTDTYTKADNFTWREILSPYLGGFVAEEVLTATKPNPNVPPVSGGQKMGIHWAQGSFDHNQGLAMLRRLHLAGTPVPCVLVLGVPGNVSVKAIKAASPFTKVLYRLVDGGNYDNLPDRPLTALTYDYGRSFMARLYGLYVGNNDDVLAADYIVPWNEYPKPDAAGRAINEFQRGAMDEAHARNIHITIGNHNPGYPPLAGDPEQNNDYWTRAETHANLRQAVSQGHALALHAYDLFGAGNWVGPYDCLRHRKIWKLLPSDVQAALPLYLTEFGDALLLNVTDDVFFARASGAQMELVNDPYVKGVTIWTLGISSEMWRESNWAPHVGSYEKLIRLGERPIRQTALNRFILAARRIVRT